MVPANKQRPKHPPGLEHVPRDATAFQSREWLAQRIGWVLLALILVAAMTGVFGQGPLADRTLVQGPVTVEYQRFTRRNSDARWQITLRDAAANGTVDVSIDARFAANFEIKAVHPEPAAVAQSNGQWVYSFATREAGEVMVDFEIRPHKVGRHAGTITVSGAPTFHLSQLVYP
jgi:hypothetical protein